MARSTRRRTFGPVVLVGLAAGALLAIGGSKPWVVPTGSTVVSPGLGASTGEVPLAGALGLVVLAAWGVILVTRGRVRLALAAVAALAGLGATVTVVRGHGQAAATLAGELGVRTVATQATGWYWTCLVAAPLGLAAAVVAIRVAGSWPAMGARYDVPASPGAAAGPTATVGDPQLDLWRALDRGQDPTA